MKNTGQSSPGPLQVVSIFSTSEKSGHSVDDDLFYFGLLRKAGLPFTFFAPPYSLKQLEGTEYYRRSDVCRIDVNQSGLRKLIEAAWSIPVPRNCKVVFLGYSELFVLIFYLANIFKNYELVLVVTNNLGVGRITKYRKFLKVFFAIIGRKLKRLVVHTEKERSLCSDLHAPLSNKVVVKKHHLMISRTRTRVPATPNKPIISFLGPEKYGKPVHPMVELIKKDTASVYQYRLYKVDEESIGQRFGLRKADNVSFVNEWLSRENFFEEIGRSTLIMMTHNRAFEGKLSGNLCDCIALGVPFISDNVEPIPWFNERYGPLGYTYDLSTSDWPERFFRDFSEQGYLALKENLQRASLDFQRDAVEQDNIAAVFL